MGEKNRNEAGAKQSHGNKGGQSQGGKLNQDGQHRDGSGMQGAGHDIDDDSDDMGESSRAAGSHEKGRNEGHHNR